MLEKIEEGPNNSTSALGSRGVSCNIGRLKNFRRFCFIGEIICIENSFFGRPQLACLT
jgi:hypothetical protein